MKIGLVVEHFDPRRGGLEQWSWQFAQALLDRGHEVHVICRSFCREAEETGLSCRQVAGGLSRLGFAQSAEEMLREMDLDIIHDTGAGWYCDVFQPHWGSWLALAEQKLLLLPRWLRPWKRLAIRCLPRYREIRRLMDRQYRNDGRLFLALSVQGARDFQRFHSIHPEHIRIVQNGVDIRRFCPENRRRYRAEIRRRFGLEEDTLTALIVAHNFRLKGAPVVIEAVRRLAASGDRVHLLVVGGKQRCSLTVGNGCRDRSQAVTFVGPVDDTAPYYAAADVYVHPTLYDTFSLVVLEAMASGLPVVTSRFNGVQELLHSGVECYLLDDPLDAKELMEKIKFFGDPGIRARMGQAARRLAEQHPFDKNVEHVLSVYEEVLQRNIRQQRRISEGNEWRPFVCRRTPPVGAEEKHSTPVFRLQETRNGYRTGDRLF